MNDQSNTDHVELEDPEFDPLRRLLALKRHETPPPGFFDQLPQRIMAQIEVPTQSRWEQLLDDLLAVRWVQRVAAFGMAALVGGLFVTAVSHSETGIQPAGATHLGGSLPTRLPAGMVDRAGVPTFTPANLNNSLDMSLQPIPTSSRALVP